MFIYLLELKRVQAWSNPQALKDSKTGIFRIVVHYKNQKNKCQS